MNAVSEILAERIRARETLHLRRDLKVADGIDFTSNDYLGFAKDPKLRSLFEREMKNQALSASAARLLRGEHPIYAATEKTCAEFSKQDAALIFPSGYQANVGLLSALLTDADQVFSDELNHASIIDGIRLGRARKIIYPHRDLQTLEKCLIESPGTEGARYIVSESIFSMDGSVAPLAKLCELAERHQAALIVDEAHATGLYGAGLIADGRLSKRVLATVHTGGKALGASGAWIAGSLVLRDYLIQFSRAFIYSTAPFPLQALLLNHSILLWHEIGQQRVKELIDNIQFFKGKLRELGSTLETSEVDLPILPVRIGDAKKTLEIATILQMRGFDIRAVRPPTVPEGSSRLRIILHADHTRCELDQLAKALHEAMETLS